MKINLLFIIQLFFISASIAQTSYSLTRYVDPFIGTQEMGHTFPGVVVPFGFVQLSPDTDTIPFSINGKYNPEVYRYCAGYQFDDPTIVGFSHTHFSGTGHSDLGDILIMPTVGNIQLNPGTSGNPKSGYRSVYRKETERASPGFYCVHLDEPDVEAELTATTRCGFHRYTFPATDSAHLIVDLDHGIYNFAGKVRWAYIRIINDSLITGYRITSSWGRTRYIYFAIGFSKPFKSYGFRDDDPIDYIGFWRKFNQQKNFPEMAGQKVKAHFDFSTTSGEQILVKVGLSAVSMEGALKNLRKEIPSWDFEGKRIEANKVWDRELQKIRINASENQKVIFYTALYHTLIHPSIYQDVDGAYRGIDTEVHLAHGFTNYTVFSLWDTYRALHPFLTLMYPHRTSDMINSMLAHFDQSPEQMLPIWSHHGNENWCMIGYHSIPVIADAAVKGIKGFDAAKALKAAITTATNRYYTGVEEYMALGFIPEDRVTNSASITLEYAYDDFTVTQLADAVSLQAGLPDMVKLYAYKQGAGFRKRSENFKNLFDTATGFVRPRNANGSWKEPFDPLNTHGEGFIEGNSWNYSFYIPHDIPGMIRLMGGEERFIQRLDSLFTMHLDDKHFAGTEDVTRVGLIGNYVHGNEPSHHIPYLYNWTSQPWKTQERIRQICRSMYLNAPDGLCGNDDCGQMSAWYIFSVLGFYPVCPGTTQYAIGSPSINEATISLSKGRTLHIKVNRQQDQDDYIQSVSLNGNLLPTPFLEHADLIKGGELVFIMGPTPRAWQ
ncbi:MAG: glycoside hydrolase family 92 protein [Bacteroidia bacterium]|nr:glycoside hydrolase family 92 protein [Bacteroidia bacterium]